ncbi:C6 transcription factor, putative [Talaromyces stipitatus ATCC 10500]|uniref:Xylanolytic transcriptional activator xlnR n=1 Tax=Talaromyces stipitatus (strain ATCC 10500 / CBS 375.48 / QM 6759 / NRRL 1006) TaxID=441959 RepID=B8MRF1_TALSN|nr:C6 transcription factor, putative [Talaromyces stipitatus ATCC 10500]EED13046.1 C6 transcription factor, putative [Talaromyces stipitatus ATCC 10500]
MAQPSQTSGLDTLAESSHYALEQLRLARELDMNNINNNSNDSFIKKDSQSDSAGSKMPIMRSPLSEARSSIRKHSAETTAAVRRRISRACDQCNQLRTKCDGQSPCAHCTESGLSCEYARERKKRGKASKKDLAEAAAKAASGGSRDSGTPGYETIPDQSSQMSVVMTSESDARIDQARRSFSESQVPQQSLSSLRELAQQPPQTTRPRQYFPSNMTPIPMNGFGQVQNVDRSFIQMPDLRELQPRSPSALVPAGLNGFHDAYNMVDHAPPSINQYPFSQPEDASANHFTGLTPPVQSPGWLPLPAPSVGFPPINVSNGFTSTLKYPVLEPLLPHIVSIIPHSLACDLLELYFASTSSSHVFPQSPYVVGYVFRKKSILHPTQPRTCSPALLASMLWVAAQTSDAPFLTSPPSARGRVCQKLLELTVGLLRPLIHGPTPGEASPNYAANAVINGVALGGFGVSMDQLGAQSSATGAIDDVATYIHLATVVSASEYKAASIRWWAAAWSLARELKLGRELPPTPSQPQSHDRDGNVDMEPKPSRYQSVTEEEREERRRIWWLLYVMDRHLALCYNRPLTLLDKECEGLLQPMNDDIWHAGDFANAGYRRAGPSLECTGHGMFGYFLPLMTILGEIVDLNHARNHPRFGIHLRTSGEWDSHTTEITRQLDVYEQSLHEFEARHTASLGIGNEGGAPDTGFNAAAPTGIDHVSPSARSSSTVGSRVNESFMQTKMVVAYGTYLMHVLHILLVGKWDPISLLDDNDLWISSEAFITAMGHAVKAAEAAADILDYDPDLSFMPFFFGIYLLQGSFLLLLTADKLQGDADPSVVRACETIVRAHEACVVTLNTEYQRNFRKVMRSALAQVRGRMPDDFGEQQQRRREVLALYRWTGDGSGLAL